MFKRAVESCQVSEVTFMAVGDYYRHLSSAKTTLWFGHMKNVCYSFLPQGPPGTGKSFVGEDIVRLLLSMQVPQSHGPILVK